VTEESEWLDVITIGIRRFDGVKVIRKMAKVLVILWSAVQKI